MGIHSPPPLNGKTQVRFWVVTYKRMYRGLGGPIKQYTRTLVQETSEPLTALWVSGWSDCFFFSFGPGVSEI